jgi:hypothetical protein
MVLPGVYRINEAIIYACEVALESLIVSNTPSIVNIVPSIVPRHIKVQHCTA